MESKPYMESAIFTVQLGCLVENGVTLQLDDYPIFDESYRETLNAKILRRYWFREIGQETPALFNFFLHRKMFEIMPYYNELYKTAVMEFDPFSNYDMTTTGNSVDKRTDTRANDHHETATSETNASNDAKTSGRTVLSNTPQMQLSGRDDYATSLTDSTSATTSDTVGNESTSRSLVENDTLASNGTTDYVNHVAGVSGVLKADALVRFRDAIINVDILVLEELAPLFMGLYSDYVNYM